MSLLVLRPSLEIEARKAAIGNSLSGRNVRRRHRVCPDAEAPVSVGILIEPADERTVSLFAEEPRIEEYLNGGTAIFCVQTPQALDLPPGET